MLFEEESGVEGRVYHWRVDGMYCREWDGMGRGLTVCVVVYLADAEAKGGFVQWSEAARLSGGAVVVVVERMLVSLVGAMAEWV